MSFDLHLAQIESALPQLQCGKCGYPDCRSYAQAIQAGRALPNRCTPGGTHTLHVLAACLETPSALDETRPAHTPARARIRADECIGCARCVPVCPTRAIVGARRYLHTILLPHCTGCGLCLPPCPVTCIDLIEQTAAPAPWAGGWSHSNADHARQRYEQRTQAARAQPATVATTDRRPEIAAAVARSRERRQGLQQTKSREPATPRPKPRPPER
ncbi:MAG TPA: RnfABCDGE type electron transport complex subunit B [Acidiferrobacteraceae bacterium]|nr:RnfABCDGE type electron transport complex subunit B [Acidiferrobacteraceae bacterium]